MVAFGAADDAAGVGAGRVVGVAGEEERRPVNAEGFCEVGLSSEACSARL